MHRVVLLPRLGRGLWVVTGKRGAAVVFDLATGARSEVPAKDARAQLAELEQLAKAARLEPPILRGRWSASVGWTEDGQRPRLELSRRLSYVEVSLAWSPAGWVIRPPKRIAKWFSDATDWPADELLE